MTIIINFSTAIVEEFVYRGVLYIWLLQSRQEVFAFMMVQVLFVLGHIPTLIINSGSVETAVVHLFFIVLLGMIHTLIFRLTKSLISSTLLHGVWNTMDHFLIIGR